MASIAYRNSALKTRGRFGKNVRLPITFWMIYWQRPAMCCWKRNLNYQSGWWCTESEKTTIERYFAKSYKSYTAIAIYRCVCAVIYGKIHLALAKKLSQLTLFFWLNIPMMKPKLCSNHNYSPNAYQMSVKW